MRILAAIAVVVAVVAPGCAERTRATPLAPTASCLSSGDETVINAALSGPAGTAVLCSGAVFELREPVVFQRDGQQLYTQGTPTGATRATLRVVGPSLDSALVLTGRNGARVSHIIVDGGRPALGRIPGGEALIRAGGDATGQIIENVRAFEPRGWSTIHAFEGERRSCSGITIARNELGPAGQGNGEWADGISLACRGSLVQHNTITDATDGGIVVFGAAGSLVTGNTILAVTRPLLGGISMVDYVPFDGDYTGTVVDANVIAGVGKQIRIGIAMGFRTWTCLPQTPPLTGATVTRNLLQGNLAYGYAVNGVTNWTVMDNVSRAEHTGTPFQSCGGRVPSAPGPFQVARGQSSGTFQDEFTDATLDSLLFGLGDPAAQPLRAGR